jgi:hypothetical protein
MKTCAFAREKPGSEACFNNQGEIMSESYRNVMSHQPATGLQALWIKALCTAKIKNLWVDDDMVMSKNQAK